MNARLPPLSLLETRVLGVLVEKQRTVPDTYPLTLNALTSGCNQKTSRDPVLIASEAEVQDTIDRLKDLSLIVESSGGRVLRYAHNVERVLGIPSQSVALLATMMLRGPQTIGELRVNTDRLHKFADTSAVDAFLRELSSRDAGPLVVELARAPGARETRWMHLLSGQPAPDAAPARDAAPAAADESTTLDVVDLKTSVDQLRDELDALKLEVASLRAEIARGQR